jgi:hypothetical protein
MGTMQNSIFLLLSFVFFSSARRALPYTDVLIVFDPLCPRPPSLSVFLSVFSLLFPGDRALSMCTPFEKFHYFVFRDETFLPLRTHTHTHRFNARGTLLGVLSADKLIDWFSVRTPDEVKKKVARRIKRAREKKEKRDAKAAR